MPDGEIDMCILSICCCCCCCFYYWWRHDK